LALVVDALVDIKRTIVLGITCRTFAHVTIGLIETITIVLAIRVETQLTTDAVAMSGVIVTLQFQIFQRGEVRILINFFVGEIVQQYTADTYFTETALKWFSCVCKKKDNFLISRKKNIKHFFKAIKKGRINSTETTKNFRIKIKIEFLEFSESSRIRD